jgi:hypothetical protein
VIARRFAPVGLLGLSLGVVLSLTPGCKASRGEVCRCAEDCRDGLVCVVGSSDVLAPGECGPANLIGHCVDDDSLSELEGGLGDLPIFLDMPSKRDFAGAETDTTESTDTGTETESSTDTGTETSTDTGTETTTDTGTETTTDTGTETSTDTGTDTGTGTSTDTGTDTSTT